MTGGRTGAGAGGRAAATGAGLGAADDAAPLRGRVFGAEYLGTTQIVIIDTAHGQVRARIAAATPARTGEIVGLRLRPELLSVFDVASGRAVKSALHEGAGHG